MLSPEDRERLEALFDLAAELPQEQRAAFVERECAQNDALRAELSLLLVGLAGPDLLGRSQAPAPSRAGTRIGPYELLERIGQGGMGEVYKALQVRPRRTVALKLLRPEFLSGDARRRFERESEFLGRLKHPGIAQIFDSGDAQTDHGPQPYFAMELVHGEPLTEFARRRTLSVNERLELLAQVADAVQHAHQQSLIHRDLKPANILVEESGQAKVLDFGIARLSDSDVRLTTMRTDVGQILGTLAYMSPEQASGDPAVIDTRSDVYSLGVILYELLADRLPYDVSGVSLPEAVRIIQEEDPQRLSAIRGIQRGDVDTIVGKALEKDKERRYASAAALASDIRRFLSHEPLLARPQSRLYTLARFVRRNKAGVAAALAVSIALLLGLAAALRFGMQEAAQRRIAEEESYRANLTVTLEALEAGNYSAARETHDRAPDALRKWEWHHLSQHWVEELARVTVPEVRYASFLDESSIVAVDESGGVHVWNPMSGELESGVERWSAGKRPLDMTDDGRVLLAYAGNEFFLGDPLGAAPPRIIPNPGHSPLQGAGLSSLAADGSRAAVTLWGKHILLVEAEGPPRQVPHENVAILSVELDRGGHRLAVRRRGDFRLWDADSLELLCAEPLSYGAVAFTPDGATLVVEAGNGTGSERGLFFKDATSGALLRSLPRWDYGAYHLQKSGELAFSADSRLLALTFSNNGIFLLDASAGRAPDEAESVFHRTSHGAVGFAEYAPMGDVLVAFGPSASSLMSVGRTDETIRLWRTGSDGAAHACRGHTGPVHAVAFSRDGATLASAGEDGSIRLWDSASGEPVATLPGSGAIAGLSFSADGHHLTALASDAFVTWDLALGRRTTHIPGEYSRVFASSADGTRLAAATADGTIRIGKAPTTTEFHELEPEEGELVSSLAFSADGSLLASGSAAAGVKLWDTATGSRLATLKSARTGSTSIQGALCMAFDPGGGQLVVGWGDSSLSVLEVPSLTEGQEMNDHRGEVFAVAFSPDGTRIASGGRDCLLRLWPGTGGERLVGLEEHDEGIRSLAFSPNGRWIGTGSEDATVRIWDSAPATARWSAQREYAAARLEALPLVARLYEELSDPEAVVERLRSDEELAPELRRLALHAVLRRELPSSE